jgi:hypothetical protein
VRLLKVERLKARTVELSGEVLKFRRDGGELELPLGSIRRVGSIKRFNRVLVALVIAMAVLTLVTQEFTYSLLTLLMLAVCILTKEEALVLETTDGRLLEVTVRGGNLKKVLRELKEATH